MKRKKARNIAFAKERTSLMPPFIIKLRGYGNADMGQDPKKMLCRPSEAIVGHIEDGSAAVLLYIGACQLGSGNWVKDAGEVEDAERQYLGRFSYNGRFWPLDNPKGYGVPHQFALGDALSDTAMEAYITIVTILARHGLTYTGGCKPFYTPQEWAQRKEKYGQNSVFVIVHDGGDLSSVFGQFGDPYGEIVAALEKLNMYVEGCTGWHSAVYLIQPLPEQLKKGK